MSKRKEISEEILNRYICESLHEEEQPDDVIMEEYMKNIQTVLPLHAGTVQILIQQVRYISKIVWIAACISFFIALMIVPRMKDDSIWFFGACLPLLAFIAEMGVKRSFIFGMAEMESVTRFSLKSIIYARFVIIGLIYIMLLSIISIFIGVYSKINALLILAYLLIPYLLTALGSLVIENSTAGRKTPYLSTAYALFVSGCIILAKEMNLDIVKANCSWCLEVTALLLGVIVILTFRKILQAEEVAFLWN